MATIKDIANKLGISISTVSKGLNGASDISADLRQLVLETAVEMGYTTKRMKKEDHKKLCVLVENMDFETVNQFGYEIILGFKQAAFIDNWEVSVVPVTPSFQASEKYDTYMLRNGFSGAFLVGFALHDDWINQLSSTSIPTVLFDNYVKRNPNVGYIGTDNAEAMDMIVEHLVNLGHKKIAFSNGFLSSMISIQRQQAFFNSMNAYNLEIRDELMAYGYFVADTAKYHVPGFLAAGATAIICNNDLMASGAIVECTQRGFRVPEDISIIGFDDLPISAHLSPALTTVRQDRVGLGKCGYFTLSSLLNHVYIGKTLLRPQLIVRNSTVPCPVKN